MWVVYFISADGETCAVGITLLLSIVYHNPNICDIPTACGGYICLVDEKMVSVPSTVPDIPCAVRPNPFL